MATMLKARSLFSAAPREAMADALGFAGVCALIFAGFMLPAFL